MPIYAYRCDACGFRKDVLQKMSDLALTTCPSCGAASFAKQLSAPAFQLKGTGWYVTDFRENGKKAAAGGTDAAEAANGSPDKKPDQKADGGADSRPDGKSDPLPKAGVSDTGGSPPVAAPKPAAKPSGASTGTAAGTSGGGAGTS